MREANLKKIQAQIEMIPPLSNTTSQLMATIGEPQHSLNDIVVIIETDSILTSLVLKTANSAAVGASKEVESVADAVRYLGDTVVAGLAMKSEKSNIYGKDLSGYLAESDSNWAHSLKTAIAARYFARRFSNGTVKESIAYTAGIVHDIGKTLLSSLISTDDMTDLQNCEFLDMELKLAGVTHAEAGYMLAKKWQLPSGITEVIRYHHSPSSASDKFKALAYTVHLADITAMMSGTGTGVDSMRHTLDSLYTKYLTISERELEKAYFEIQLEYNSTFKAIQASFLSFDSQEQKGKKS